MRLATGRIKFYRYSSAGVASSEHILTFTVLTTQSTSLPLVVLGQPKSVFYDFNPLYNLDRSPVAVCNPSPDVSPRPETVSDNCRSSQAVTATLTIYNREGQRSPDQCTPDGRAASDIVLLRTASVASVNICRRLSGLSSSRIGRLTYRQTCRVTRIQTCVSTDGQHMTLGN